MTNRIPGITRTLLLYRFLQILCFPFILLYFLARLTVDRAYWSHFGERFGFLPQSFSRTAPRSIWLHAVSVGEVASAVPLIRQLAAHLPAVPIYVSTATVAGRRTAHHQLAHLVSGIFYAPLDFASFVRRVLRKTRPALVVVLETEIWPNLYMEVKRSGAGLAVVNGRISNRAWPRYQRFRRLFRPVLALPDLIFVQSTVDGERYAQLGAPDERIVVEGNLKYDIGIASSEVHLNTFGAHYVWIAASTAGPNERGSLRRHDIDEDEIVVQVFRKLAQQVPRLLLILAPRQLSRFDTVAAKLHRSGVPFVRRSDEKKLGTRQLQLPGVFLLDSIGELPNVYGLADVAFIGGSIAPRGGHNIIEPAAASVPVVVGPHMHNFERICSDFAESNAIRQVRDAAELESTLRELLLNPQERRALARRASAVVQSKRGVSTRVAARLRLLYSGSFPTPPRSLLSGAVLSGLAQMWVREGERRQVKHQTYARTAPVLGVPVISIGGITVGGSGKTPLVKWLAEQLKQRAFSPAILTRGYRRRSTADMLILAPGARIPPAFTGDEAQIFVRSAIAPVGIGADRYATARTLLNSYPHTDVLILDDAFQHVRMPRDLDIVVIDGLDPFGGNAAVPAGRLREPLDALERASIFIISRAEDDFTYDGIREVLQRINPKAPVYRSRLIARRWFDYKTRKALSHPAAKRVAAFCGLGNPQNFWNTLESLNLQTVFQWTFSDHHHYKLIELQRLARQARAYGAEALVTTEKDCNNLPENVEGALGTIPLLWLEVELKVDRESGFLAEVENVISRKRSAESAR
ncbi:MAG: tetraacyldisaccharide 4'-kinase [Acidobacteriaceae bacterium]|nr:tetraacyldisaccharide 4'-kinase [Acidobacteriaceae bacterium]